MRPDGRGRTMARALRIVPSFYVVPFQQFARLRMCAGAIRAPPRTEGTNHAANTQEKRRMEWDAAIRWAHDDKEGKSGDGEVAKTRGPVCFDMLLLGRQEGGAVKWTNHIARTR